MPAYQWTWVAMLPMLSGVLLAALAVWIRSYRHESLGRAFFLFLASTSVWSWAYMAELLANKKEVALFWANVQYFGIPTTPVAFFLFAFLLSGKPIRDRRIQAGFALVCIAMCVLVWTDDSHHLVRQGLSFIAYGSYRVLHFTKGPAYLANLTFCYSLLGIAIIRLIQMARRTDSLSRKHAQIILVGLSLPVAGNLCTIIGYQPMPGIDQTPIFFSLTACATAYGVFRWSLISVAPVARDKVIDRLADAVVVIDPRGRVVDANPAASRLFGLTAEELTRASAADISQGLPEGTLSSGPESIFQLLERSYIVRTTQLVNAANASLGVLLQFTDITDQRRVEDALRHAKVMAEEANAAKSQFVAHVSHELRTPLNGVIGLAQLLNETNLDPVQHDYLTGIRQCSETLLGLVNDVLDLSRIEADAMPVAREPIQIDDLLNEVVGVHRHAAQSKGLRLSGVVRGMPEYIEGDPLRLRQVLNNLIGNAVKFTENGSIEVTVDCVESLDEFLIRVADTGIGIPKEMQQAVFEPFRQADDSTTRRFGGTGLGLPITRGLVKRMGGSISLTSREGVGTTMTVQLPLVPIHPPEPAKTEEPLAPGLRVLVAEDNEVNALVITSLLEGMGCRVHLQENGQAALDAYERGVFDVVLLDIQMPLLDGFQVCRAIRQRYPERATPIYALTANVLDEERQNAKAAGMNGFLTKPIRMNELLTALRDSAPV